MSASNISHPLFNYIFIWTSKFQYIYFFSSYRRTMVRQNYDHLQFSILRNLSFPLSFNKLPVGFFDSVLTYEAGAATNILLNSGPPRQIFGRQGSHSGAPSQPPPLSNSKTLAKDQGLPLVAALTLFVHHTQFTQKFSNRSPYSLLSYLGQETLEHIAQGVIKIKL